MSGSVARAFTTKRSKRPDISAPVPQRSASTKPGYNIVRSQISSPVELISTTNMLSYNAPDIYPNNHSPISENDSESSRSNLTSPPTSPDSSSIGSIPGSPEPNHLSPYFNNAPDYYQNTRDEAPVVPKRALSHTKSNHELVHRHRSQRGSNSKNSLSVPPNSSNSNNNMHMLKKNLSSPQMNASISASMNAPLQMPTNRMPSVTSPPPAMPPQMYSSNMSNSRQNSMSNSRQNSMSSSRQGSTSSSHPTSMTSYSSSSSAGSRQNSMSSSRKNSFTSTRPSSSKSNGSQQQVAPKSPSNSSANIAVSRSTIMMFSGAQSGTPPPPVPAMPTIPPILSHPQSQAKTSYRTVPQPLPQSLPQSPPPNRSLPEPPHPFGKELAQVSELAETYGSKLGVVDEEERDLVSRGFMKFSAQDYINEIQGLFSNVFVDIKPRPVQNMLWI